MMSYGEECMKIKGLERGGSFGYWVVGGMIV